MSQKYIGKAPIRKKIVARHTKFWFFGKEFKLQKFLFSSYTKEEARNLSCCFSAFLKNSCELLLTFKCTMRLSQLKTNALSDPSVIKS